MGLIKNVKTKYNIQVQDLHCDNTDESIAFKNACKQEELGMEFEFTAPGTPQQNSPVKQFTTLFNQVCTMLICGKFTTFLRNSLWTEAANTTTLLKNNLIITNSIISPFQHFFG